MQGNGTHQHISDDTTRAQHAGGHNARPTIGVFLPDLLSGNNEAFWLGTADTAQAYDVNLMSLVGGFVRSLSRRVLRTSQYPL